MKTAAALAGILAQAAVVSSTYDVTKVDFTYIRESQKQNEIDLCEGLTNCGGIIFYSSDEYVEMDENHPEVPERKPRTVLNSNARMTNTTSNHDEDEEDEDEAQEELLAMLRLLVVPEYYFAEHEDIFVSSKPWIIQRGAVQISTRDYHEKVLGTAKDMNIIDAQEWCESRESCIAFSFPLQSQRTDVAISDTVDQIIFVSEVASFDVGPSTKVLEFPEEEDKSQVECGQTEWITHIINDRSRLSGRINKHINIADSNWRTHSTTPYRPCCGTPHNIPTIREIEPLDTLPRISCDISREEFYEKYETTRTPVILVGCDENWPAYTKWRDIPTLLNRFDNSSDWRAPHATTWEEFGEYYGSRKGNADKDVNPYRVFQILEPGYKADEIHKDYSVPRPFVGADMFAQLPSYTNTSFFPNTYDGPMHWFLIGSNGTGTGPHTDPHATDAWNTLLHGHKWWTIYPKRPNVITEGEAKCYRECSEPGYNNGPINNDSGISWYSSVGRYVHKMFYGHNEAPQHVMQKAGETIYVPYGMVHSVMNMDDTIAITQNYGAPGNFDEVWREILHSGEEDDWKHFYYSKLDKYMRQRARDVLWPVNEEARGRMTGNHEPYQAYDHEELGDSDDRDDDSEDQYQEEEEEYLDEEEDEIITEEEFEALSDEEKANYAEVSIEPSRGATLATMHES